jgi:hypothetical protein
MNYDGNRGKDSFKKTHVSKVTTNFELKVLVPTH